MSEEIFVNIGTGIQQTYTARVPANAQEPNSRQTSVQSPAQARQPSTYQFRSPSTYNNPVAAQEPNIRDARQPSTYVRQGQTPAAYQHQSPFTYSKTAQIAVAYTHRSPFTYQRTGQQPNTYTHRSPFTYSNTGRLPSIYQHPSPFAYQNPVSKQTNQPAIAQQPYPYIANVQEPNIRSQQEPNIRSNQTAFTYNHRSPFTYQNPSNKRSPFTYSHRSPFTYTVSVSAQQPLIKDAQAQVSKSQQESSIRNSQTAFDYQHRTPSTYQNPLIAQVPYPYIASSQQTFLYSHRSPATYARQGQNPFTYNVRTPALTDLNVSTSGRQPNIYDGVDGDDNGDNSTEWGPNTTQAQVSQTSAQTVGITSNRQWITNSFTSFGGSCDVHCQMLFNYKSSGSNANSCQVEWRGHKSTISQAQAVYQDFINVHSPIDSSYTWAVKWNSSGESNFQNGGTSTGPTLTKNTYYELWDGSSTATQRLFNWTSSVSSGGESSALTQSNNMQITVRLSKSGQTSIYTSTPTQSVILNALNTGGGGFGGG